MSGVKENLLLVQRLNLSPDCVVKDRILEHLFHSHIVDRESVLISNVQPSGTQGIRN